MPSTATGGSFTASNYSITYTPGSLTVDATPLSVTANARSKSYGQTLTLGTTAFTASGLVNGDTVTGVTLTSTGAAATATLGSYNIVPSAATGGNLYGCELLDHLHARCADGDSSTSDGDSQ